MTVKIRGKKVKRVRLTKLKVGGLIAGSTVTVSCSGAGCGKTTSIKVKGTSVNLIDTRTLKGKLLARNALIKVKITLKGHKTRTLYYVAP